jgi:hypothetical protein
MLFVNRIAVGTQGHILINYRKLIPQAFLILNESFMSSRLIWRKFKTLCERPAAH